MNRFQDQPILFRATSESWLGKFLLPFLFAGLLLVTLSNWGAITPLIGAVAIVTLIIIGLLEFLIPMLTNWVRIEKTTIEAHLNGRRVKIYWTEVQAAWTNLSGRQPLIYLGTNTGTVTLPLRFFPIEKVWGEVRRRVPSSALDPLAKQKLPEYQEWLSQRNALIRQVNEPRAVVDHWFLQIIGWAGAIFFIAMAYSCWSARQFVWMAFFLLVALASFLPLMNWGITIFDKDGITRRTAFGTFRFDWEEMRRVEFDLFGTWLVLEGNNKRLSLTGPALWISPERDELFILLRAQADLRQATVRRSLFSLFKFTRNARLKNK